MKAPAFDAEFLRNYRARNPGLNVPVIDPSDPTEFKPASLAVRALASPAPIAAEWRTTELMLTIEGPPIPKGRPRSGKGKTFTPKRTRDAERRIKGLATAAGFRPIAGPVRFEVQFYLPTARRVDLDNLVKLATDSLNTVAYLDDSQIVDIAATKEIDRKRPRTVIAIRSAGLEIVFGRGVAVTADFNSHCARAPDTEMTKEHV